MNHFRLLIFCFLLPIFCRAQKEAQTPSEILAGTSFALASSNPDRALLLANAGLKTAKAASDAKGFAASLNARGMAQYRLGNNDSAEVDFLQAIAAYQAQHNTQDEARALINLSALYTDQERNEEAMQCIIRARKYMELANDEAGKAYAEKMIGILYRQNHQYPDAILHLTTAIRDFKRIGQLNYMADAQSSLGSVYRVMGNNDSAFYYYQAALSYNKQQQNVNGMAFASENIGDVFYAKSGEQYNQWIDSALTYYQLAFQLFSRLQNRQSSAYEKLMMGNLWAIKGKSELSRRYLLAALHTFDSGGNHNYTFLTLDGLSKLEGLCGNYQAAFSYSRRELGYKDSLASSNRKEVMSNLFARYEVEKKDRTIALLNAQKKLTAQELHHRHILDLVYIVMALAAIFITLMFFNIYRVRQRLKEVEMRHQLSADLHDEVGSSLSSILLLSKMAISRQDDADIQLQLLTTIRRNANEVIERIGDIVWTTDPKFDDVSSLRARMENYLSEVAQSTGMQISTEISDEIADARYPMIIRKNIFLIFKEAVNNAAKHAGATSLDVFFGREQGSTLLRIRDNGRGFIVSQTQTGKGLHTMEQRAAALGSRFELLSSTATGTAVSLYLPANLLRKFRPNKAKTWKS